jgi:CheY-like chemotaxis protein
MTTSSKKVLLVDDEPFILNVMKSYLDPAVYEIDTAGCGNEALELIKAKDYDCIVTDVRMPNGNGHELLSAVREIKKLGPPIMFATGFSDIPPEELMFRGADSFILKPFNSDDFNRELSRLVLPATERLAVRPNYYEALKSIQVNAPDVFKTGSSGEAAFGRGGFFTTIQPEGIRANQNLRFTVDIGNGKTIKGCGRLIWARRPRTLNPASAGTGILLEYLEPESLPLYLSFLEKNTPFSVIPKDLT